jgi:hypothetical protein
VILRLLVFGPCGLWRNYSVLGGEVISDVYPAPGVVQEGMTPNPALYAETYTSLVMRHENRAKGPDHHPEVLPVENDSLRQIQCRLDQDGCTC